MSETNKIAAFFKVLEASIEENGFISLTLSKPKDKHSLVKNIYLRPILLQSEEMIQMVIKYPTREETKNLSVPDFLAFLSLSLQSHFGYAHVLLKNQEGHLLVSNRGFVTLKWKKTTLEAFQLPIHDKEKQYLVSTEAPFLRPLGIASASGNIIKEHYKKYKQISRYIELFAPLTESLDKAKKTTIVDMGCGKGYLTFAMHDWMRTSGFTDVETLGIDIKSDVIASNNKIGQSIGYDGLEFINGTIDTTEDLQPDILVALHACDTATDDALFYAIQQQTKIIVVAPCCHKQVRKSIGTNDLTNSLLKYGIIKERFATDLTDMIRANILKYLGYQVKVMEFVGLEHTPKNIMITAVYNGQKNEIALEEIHSWMTLFSISNHYLLDRLQISVGI
ncbi:MAG: SAM-dependent methyltransferase [Saprospiraceae bacterium]|nr:SAM-dependent methyltransferase [Candidatus Brachybacter algidus]